jgi:hypothetical protein
MCSCEYELSTLTNENLYVGIRAEKQGLGFMFLLAKEQHMLHRVIAGLRLDRYEQRRKTCSRIKRDWT